MTGFNINCPDILGINIYSKFCSPVKSSLNSLYSKAHANKTNYLAFVVITVVLAWLVLGKFGVSIAIIYFIFKINNCY